MNEENRNEVGRSEGLLNRRDFLKTSAATAATAALMASGNYAFAQGSDRIRVGIIGCGGRGTDAGNNVCDAAEGVELVALADMFQYRVDGAKNALKGRPQYKVKDENVFVGFDAYKKLLASNDVNYVILATPPGFRPEHIRAAVDAGKHIFTEKPVAVDGWGVRAVIEAGEKAKTKGLGIVAGTQRRHQQSYIDTIKKLHDGAIGDIVGGQVYWNQGSIWVHPKKDEWSDVEWHLRNWYYFTYLCGDHICEQHVHNLDVANWVLGAHPVKCLGIGGRQVRTDPVYGHIYDHFVVEYEYPNGTRIQSMCRQQDGTTSNVSERFQGTKGRTNPGGSIETPGAPRWRYDGPTPNPYVVEHTDNINAIRFGKPLNEARMVAEATLTAIMGRESAYTGQELTWDQVLNANTKLMPDDLKFGPLQTPPVAVPGKTKLERAWNG